MPSGQPNPSPVRQIRQGDVPVRRQRIVVAQHHADPIGAEHVGADSVGVEWGSRQRHVDQAGPQTSRGVTQVGFGDDHVDVWLFAAEGGDQSRADLLGGIGERASSYRTAPAAVGTTPLGRRAETTIGPMLNIACFPYDATRALFDDSVSLDGAAFAMHTAGTLPEIFERMMRQREFVVSELGLTFHLRVLDGGDDSLVALPVFPSRVFRHSCVYVTADSGITAPADLVGKTIGEFGTYGQDSGVWAKGNLMGEHGFRRNRTAG